MRVIEIARPSALARQTKILQLFLIATLFIALSSCGGGGGGSGSDVTDNVVASVAVVPGTVLLTGLDETLQLEAQAYNASGEPVQANISWSSNDAATVSVNASGLATAEDFSGSAVLTAEADGISSPPVLAVVVMPALNTVLVVDDQVKEVPQLQDPEAEIELGTTYTLTLGSEPAVTIGDILLGQGDLPIAGQVIEVVNQPNGDQLITLELVGLERLFTRLVIDEELDLFESPLEVPQQVAELYDVSEQPDGSYLFTPKEGAAATASSEKILQAFSASVYPAATSATGTTALGPFQCDVPTTVTLPISLPGVLPTFTLTKTINFILDYDSNTQGLKKLAINVVIGAEAKIKVVLEASVTAKLECKAELFVITIPIGGPLAFFFGGQVPLGASFDVGGKLNLVELGFEIFSKADATAETGIQCPPMGDCSAIGTIATTSSSDYKMLAPSSSNVSSQLQFEPSFGGAVYAELAIGTRFFRRLRLSAFEIKAGPRQAANLSFVENQINDGSYASDYKLTLDTSIGTTASFERFLGLFALQAAKLELKGSIPLATSPKATSARADVDFYMSGERVTVSVELDGSSVSYLGGYNVDKISLYRKIPLAGGGSGAQFLTSVPASSGQTSFSIPWVADADGDIASNFYIFVTTVLNLPFVTPSIIELELKQVASASAPTADVTGNWAGSWNAQGGFSGGVDAVLALTGNSLSGTALATGAPPEECPAPCDGEVTGTLIGSEIVIGTGIAFTSAGSVSVTFSGEVGPDGNSMSGTHNYGGTWEMTRQ